MKRTLLMIALVLLLLSEIALLGWLISTDGQAATAKFYYEPYSQNLNDRPLLTSYEQIDDATTRGFCSFYCGGSHYLAENLPAEYIDYSANYLEGNLQRD